MWPVFRVGVDQFQSTLPRGSDNVSSETLAKWANFNPRSLAGATRFRPARLPERTTFQSTLPRGSDLDTAKADLRQVCISIHAPSRERHNLPYKILYHNMISIHAPSRERP